MQRAAWNLRGPTTSSTRSIADNAPALFWQDPVRTYVEALEMGALIEEDQGHRHAADLLFDQALALIEPDAFEETRYAINLSYAAVLEARGDLKKCNAVLSRGGLPEPSLVAPGYLTPLQQLTSERACSTVTGTNVTSAPGLN